MKANHKRNRSKQAENRLLFKNSIQFQYANQFSIDIAKSRKILTLVRKTWIIEKPSCEEIKKLINKSFGGKGDTIKYFKN